MLVSVFFSAELCLILFFVSGAQYTLLRESPMSAEAARRAPMMSLRELVARYQTLAGGFGKPVAFSAFNLTPAETERIFSSYDEDYHISRFFHFSDSGGMQYSINGIPATHVSIDAEIESIL
jgi:hypothetical protein